MSRLCACVGFVAVACILGSAVAADQPSAEDLVKQFGGLIKGAGTFRVKVTAVTKMEAEGMKHEYTTRSMLSVAHPGRVASVLEYGLMGATVVCDGKKMVRYMPLAGRYTEEDAPADLGEALADGGPGMMMGGSFPLMAALVAADPAAVMLDGVSNGEYLGNRKLDGVECLVVRFKQTGFNWEAWFETGKKPMLRRVIPDISTMMTGSGAEMPAAMKNMKYEMSFDLSGWELGVALPDKTFVFNPPPGSEKADDMFGFEGGGGEGTKNPMIGKPAPDFSVDLVDGGKFKLSEQKGKVVVLDFWASWCVPCRKGLPAVVKVTSELAGRGVVFCGVNEQEDADTIKEFRTDEKLQFPVGMDTEGSVGSLYGVRGIPTTVVVDREGVVLAVHSGFSPGMESLLKSEIETALGQKTP
jgi:peroxiredoxin